MFHKTLAVAIVAAGVSLVSASGAVAAPVLTNGSFEAPGLGGGAYSTLNNGDTTITGWTVGGSDIDYIGSYWQASNGSHSLDLNGYISPGSISQTITGLTVGSVYRIFFDMAGNPDSGPALKTLEVDLDGVFQNAFQFDTTGMSHGAMGWTTNSFDFTATGASQLLAFVSTTTGFSGNADHPYSFGPALDNVSIDTLRAAPTAVPEPLTLSVFGAGLAGVVAARRRRRNSAKA